MTGTETHPASCKFCALPISLHVHPDSLGMFSMAVWVKLAACNKCADYHTRRNAITHGVQRLANLAFQATASTNVDDKRDAINRCHTKLTELTRKLATNAADHYRNGFIWEPDWVEQILNQPDKATMSCTFFERQQWRAWRRRRETIPA